MVQLPAVNTPQFDWARSRLPHRPQPVPPIFQPEAIAQRILWAAEHAPRELWVGSPTLQAIIGTMAMPGWLDRIAARRAWAGQMTDARVAHGEAGNLFEAPAGDPGSHGRFDRRSRNRVPAMRDTYARAGVVAAAAIALGAAWASARLGRRLIGADRGGPRSRTAVRAR
jgi:hypothetical protein